MRPSLSTGTGDGGDTGLIGKRRVSKAHERIEAYGTVDELNAALGVALSAVPEAESRGSPFPDAFAAFRNQLISIQRLLFRVGSDLAGPPEIGGVPRVEEAHVTQIEAWAVALEKDLPPLTQFILPSGSRAGSALHLARTICRRAERRVVSLEAIEDVNPLIRVFLNRLSDYLFLAARAVNAAEGVDEEKV